MRMHAFTCTHSHSYACIVQVGMDYGRVCELIALNGEPGVAWLDNMRNYSRINGQVRA